MRRRCRRWLRFVHFILKQSNSWDCILVGDNDKTGNSTMRTLEGIHNKKHGFDLEAEKCDM